MSDSSSYRLILVAVLAVAGLAAFLWSRNPARDGFILFIAALGLGYRTVAVTDVLRIQPAEVIVLVVLLASLNKARGAGPSAAHPALPWWLWGLLPFMALGWLPRDGSPDDWDVQLAEFINVALIVPTFLAARAVLAERASWRPVVISLYATGVVVALLGGVEYVYPNIRNVLPGFVSNPQAFESAGGFLRANFSFYGHTIAVFLCILALPFGLALWSWYPGPLARLATAAGATALLGGLYISGYRSQWLMTGVLILLIPLVRRRFLVAAALVGAAILCFQFLPEETRDRLASLEKVLEGNPEDTSGVKRKERIEQAFESVADNPLGGGWASAGWVHSDFLQVAANLGLPAGLLLLLGYLQTLIQLARRMAGAGRQDEYAVLGFPLFLSFLVVGQMLAVQGVEFMPFTILPVWLVWALAETWLRQAAVAPSAPPAFAGATSLGGFRWRRPTRNPASSAPEEG